MAMMRPEIDYELGRMVWWLWSQPLPEQYEARMAELHRRDALRAHWIESARTVQSVAELHAKLAAEGKDSSIGDDEGEKGGEQ